MSVFICLLLCRGLKYMYIELELIVCVFLRPFMPTTRFKVN